jgi:hypothetical protein
MIEKKPAFLNHNVLYAVQLNGEEKEKYKEQKLTQLASQPQ